MAKELRNTYFQWIKTNPFVNPVAAKLCTDAPCFMAESRWTDLGGIQGYWELTSDMQLRDIVGVDGYSPRITRISIDGMRLQENAWDWNARSDLAIVADDGERWMRQIMVHPKNTWSQNEWDLDLDLSQYIDINFRVYQKCVTNTGYLNWKDGYLIVEGDYLTDTPPPQTDVEIGVLTADELQEPVPDARVLIMSGSQVVAAGYTDETGSVIFPNIDDGTYSVKITKSGFYPLDARLDVSGGSMLQFYNLVQVEGPVLPIDPKWILAGVVAAGAGYVIIKSQSARTFIVEKATGTVLPYGQRIKQAIEERIR
jgi:hypothetical protein